MSDVPTSVESECRSRRQPHLRITSRRRTRFRRQLRIEELEERTLLSGGPKSVEVGSAVFRGGVGVGDLQFGHAGIYWMYDGYSDQDFVIQAQGLFKTVDIGDWDRSTPGHDSFLQGEPYWGSRELSGVTVSEAQRQSIIYTALYQLGARYVLGALYEPNSSWQRGDGAFRCDTLVQYAYQVALDNSFNNLVQTPLDMLYAPNASPVTPIAPRVSWVSPSVQTDGALVIDFSELMSRGTLDPSSDHFSISLSGSIHHAYTLSSADVAFESRGLTHSNLFYYLDSTGHRYHSADRVTIKPQGGFVPGETLTLRISTGAKDLGGNSLQGAFETQVHVVPQVDGAALIPPKGVPDNTVMSPGQPFTQTWTLRNTGTSDWTPGITGYTLNRVGAGPMSGGTWYLELSRTVRPGEEYAFSLNLTAPPLPGTYKETWQMYGADTTGGVGTSFGDKVTVQIVVPGVPANQPPTIGWLSDNPDPVTQGSNLTLTANSVTDSDGTVTAVQFYRESNGQPGIQTGSGGDAFIGNGTQSGANWAWKGSTAGFPVGANVYLSRAQDDDGEWSFAALTSGTVAPPPSPPDLTIGEASVTEGNSGTIDCSFAVVLSAAATQNVTVQYATADGSATLADGDYLAASGTLTIPAGQISGTITVKVIGDTKYEEDQYFVVNLSNAVGASIVRSQASGTILNDDGQPEIVVQGWFGGTAIDIWSGKGNPEWGNGTYFGTVLQNSTPPTRTFTVKNTGTAPLTVGTPTVPLGFTIIEPLNSLIAVDGTDDFTVQMTTASVGTPSGNISFNNNDEDQNPFYFAISGTVTYVGAAATTTVLNVSPSSAVYGQPVTFTAAVGGLPPRKGTPVGGTVTFVAGTALLGSTTLSNGIAVLTTTSLAANPQSVTAIYSGDGSEFASSSSSIGSNLILRTVAGTSPAGYRGDGGPATEASLSMPLGIAVDSSGNLFIADTSNGVVRKVDHSTGTISTIAGVYGSPDYNGENIQATAAGLAPCALAVDESGHLFIVDCWNRLIRQIDLSTGLITTVAGNRNDTPPYYNGDDIQATAASLCNPRGVAVDNRGNLFIADTNNDRIRQVNLSTGIITTVAGGGTGDLGDDGLAKAATLSAPYAVAIDASGNLFIADTFNHRIRKVDHVTHIITTVAGNGIAGSGGDDGAAKEASLNQPSGVAIDSSGNLLIADTNNARIRKLDLSTGKITTVAGGGSFTNNGPALAAALSSPSQITVDTSGNLFVADPGYSRIREVAAGNTSADITRAKLTVTADSKNRIYGAENPSFTVTVAGFQNGETLATSGVSGSPSSTTNATSTSPVGSYTITASLGTLAANNYNFTFANGTLTISQARLTAHITVEDKIYNGTAAATIVNRSLSGLISSDVVGLSGGVATFVNKNVGVDKPVTVTGLTLTGTDAANYTVSSTASTTADISPAPLTASVVVQSKVYDGRVAAEVISRSLTGVLKSDEVDVAGGNAAFVNKNVGTVKTVTVTDLSLTGADAENYAVNLSATTTADVTPAPLMATVTVNSKVYDSTTDATIADRLLSGVIGLDNVALSGGLAIFVDRKVGTRKTVTVTDLSLTGADAENYTADKSTTALADIAPASLTVSGVTAGDKTYDGNTVASLSTGNATLVGVVGTDTVTLNSVGAAGTFANRNIGTWTVTVSGLTLSGADKGNYTLAQPTTSATIGAKGLTVTGFAADDKPYDGTTSAVVSSWGSLSGVVGSETVTLVTTGATAGFPNKNVGTWTVTAAGLILGGGDAGNYTLTLPTDTSAITAKGLTVTGVTAGNKTYDGNTVASLSTGGATLVGVVGTEAVSPNSVGAAGIFANRNIGTWTVTVSGLTLSGADKGNYTLAQPTTTATIGAKGLTVTGFAADDKPYDGTTSAVVSSWGSLSGVVGSETVTLVTTGATANFPNKNVGIWTVTAAGLILGGGDAGNYTLTQPADTSAITAKGLTVTGVTAGDKTYDGNTMASLSAGSATLVGVVGTDTVTLNPAGAAGTFANRNIGTWTVTVSGLTLSGADKGNYTLAQPTTSATIGAKGLTVTGFAADDKPYDGTTSAVVSSWGSLSGVVGSETVTLVTTGATAGFPNKNVGTWTVTAAGLILGGGDAGNYTLTLPTDTSAITAKGLTVTGVTAGNKTYDGNTVASLSTGGATLVGVVGTEAVSSNSVGAAGTFANRNIGTWTVTVSGLTLSGADKGNYTLAQPTTTATIGAKGLTVTGFTADDKPYDGTTSAVVSSWGSLSGVVGSETVTLVTTGATAGFPNKNVGTWRVTAAGLILGGGDAGNYTLAQPTDLSAITAKGLTVTGVTAGNKTYDGNTLASLNANGATLVGVVVTEAVTLNAAGAMGTFADKSVGGKSVAVAGLTISGADASNYTLLQPTLWAIILPSPLTVTGITVSDKVYNGTFRATVNFDGASLVGLFAGDMVTLNTDGAGGDFDTTDAGTNKAVSIVNLSISGPQAFNYSLVPTAFTASITPRPVTVMGITASDKVYDGDAASTLNVSGAVLVGTYGADTVALNAGGATGTFADKTAGTGKTVTVAGLILNGADAGNYQLTQPTTTANITPASLTVTADNKSKASGAPVPELTVGYSGFVDGETASSLVTLPTITTTAAAGSPGGIYPITPSGAASLNYAIVYVPGVLTVAPAAPVITGITEDTGVSPTDGVTADTTLALMGTAEPNNTVSVFQAGITFGITTASASGTWSLDCRDTPLPEGRYQFTARAAERPGNTSADSSVLTVVIDSTSPVAQITDATPNPRNTNFGIVTINFTEPVTGVDSGDFHLLRNGSELTLTGLTVSTISDAQLTIDLSTFTAASGAYNLTLVARGSEIGDMAGNPLAGDAVSAFVVHPWQNVRSVFDVNNDSNVTPLDVLLIINEINSRGAGPISLPVAQPPFVDVNGDDSMTPADVLLVVNFINQAADQRTSSEGEFEPIGLASMSSSFPRTTSAQMNPLHQDPTRFESCAAIVPLRNDHRLLTAANTTDVLSMSSVMTGQKEPRPSASNNVSRLQDNVMHGEPSGSTRIDELDELLDILANDIESLATTSRP